MTAAASDPSMTRRAKKEPPLLDGKYALGRVLGSGAMGTVYEATNALVGKRVAVKVLHPELARAPEARTRFVAEARVAARIAHAHVADTHDLGMTEDGTPYMVMELLEGETLGGILATRSLSSSYSCELMLQVLAGLSAAHRVGIVHRDLKPANIMVTHPRPDRPLVKVLDFGIARGVLSSGCKLDEQGSLLGTPLYMAPEQAIRPDVDERADVYSAAAILYEMLAGKPPFDGDTPEDVLVAMLTSDPEPLTTLNPNVPEGLWQAVRRAMDSDPAQRTPTAADFARELMPFATGPTESRWRISASAWGPSSPVPLPLVREPRPPADGSADTDPREVVLVGAPTPEEISQELGLSPAGPELARGIGRVSTSLLTSPKIPKAPAPPHLSGMPGVLSPEELAGRRASTIPPSEPTRASGGWRTAAMAIAVGLSLGFGVGIVTLLG